MPADLIISSSANSLKRLYFGYDNVADSGVISSAESGVDWKNISINPFGGNVGIGTAAPAAKLEVNGDMRLNSSVKLEEPAVPAALIISDPANGLKRLYLGYDLNVEAAVISSTESGVDWKNMLLNPYGGNVGIGTPAPKATLDVNGDIRLAKNYVAPVTCNANYDGRIALTSKYTTCVCRGGSADWVQTSDGATACLW